jgi:hypothetical protein
VTCPKNRDGRLVPRRARRTGNVFWGCSKYPKCDYTTNHEPLGGLHDVDGGPLARKDGVAICLICGSLSAAGAADVDPGNLYPGGPANLDALARPARARAGGRSGAKSTPKGRAKPRSAGSRGTIAARRRSGAAEPAPDA